MEYEYLLYSVLLGLCAGLYYQLYKNQIKDREAKGLFGIWNYGVNFSSFFIIFFLICSSIAYLLYFLNIL